MFNQNDLYVLLYSNYSTSCSDLITQLKKYPLYFSHINLLCIDNEQLRKKILSSNLIKVTFVPCLLIVSNNGVTKQYENTQLFEFITEIIESNTQQTTQQKTTKNIKQKNDIVEDSDDEPEHKNESKSNDNSTSNVMELLDLDSIDIGENKVVSNINSIDSKTGSGSGSGSGSSSNVSNVMQLAQEMQKSREQAIPNKKI